MCILVVYSQNVGFGLPSTFDWMEKYVDGIGSPNPFELDVFDPFANHSSAQKGQLPCLALPYWGTASAGPMYPPQC